MHRPQDKFRIKKKIRINSLQAAICNVALFKSMKDKDFRDTIFISYCEEGVILEAVSQIQWRKAHQHIQSFLQNKKIQLLIDGFDKDEYEALINKGLKQITRKIRESDEQCPYINIIHYQKLRKSCQYMDKERYVQPLKDWERKNKKNHNFAFLIVEPKQKFDQIKRCLLEYLLNEPITMTIVNIEPIQLLHLLFFCPSKQVIKNNCNRRQIQISIQKQEETGTQVIKAINYTEIDLHEYTFSIINSQSKITKSGVSLEVIPISQMKQQIKNTKLYCKDNPCDLIEKALEKLQQQYGQNFIVVPYRKQEEPKFKGLIQKYTNTKLSKQQIQKRVQMHRIFSEQQIQFLEQMYTTKNYKCYKVCVNNSPYIIHEYKASSVDLCTFVIYLQQLQTYYCTYMIRYYGLIIKHPTPRDSLISNEPTYLLVFDFHQSNLIHLLENDMILDSMQIASIILQILYLVNFLHCQDQPRCLGPIQAKQIFWPMAIALPYLGLDSDEPIYSMENDIKQVGQLMKEMMGEEEDEDFNQIICQMINPNKYERPSAKKCIAQLEEMLCL